MPAHAFRGALGGALAFLLALTATAAAHDDGSRDRHRGVSRQIDRCGTIRAPGAYVLVANLSARGDCLKVRADYVTIDLAGFAVSGNGAGRGITDEGTQRAGITVRDGTITGFAVAIDLAATPASRVTRTRVIGNAKNGGGQTLVCDDANNVEGIAAGIVTASGSDVSGNIVRSNAGLGIFVGSGSRVVDNVVYGNGPGSANDKTATGICNGSGSTVTGNTLRKNTGLGLQANSGSTVRGNTAKDNAAGLAVNSGSTVAGNTAKDNASFGIKVNCPSNVIGNTAYANGSGIVLEDGTCSDTDNVSASASP